MINLQRAFRTDAVSLGDIVGIFSGDGDPSSEDVNGVPLGSLFLRTNGQIYRKSAQPNQWEPLVSSSIAMEMHQLTASDGGHVPFLMMPDPNVPGGLISVNTGEYAFFEKRMYRNEYLKAAPGDTGIDQFVMPFDGIIFGLLLHAQKVNISPRNVCMLLNDEDVGCISLPKKSSLQTQGAFGLNISFNRGDILQMRDQSSPGEGNARMVRGIIHVRWRAI
jgi:hypothetical protein